MSNVVKMLFQFSKNVCSCSWGLLHTHRPAMPSAPDWAEGSIFLSQCEDDELVLNYAVLALECCVDSALLACLAVAVVYAWRHCMDGGGKARTGVVVSLARWRMHGSTCQTCKAASTQTDFSFAADQLWPAMTVSRRSHAAESASSRRHKAAHPNSDTKSRSDPSVALAEATSLRPRSKSDSPAVTLRRHARKDSHRPVAEKTSAKPGKQQPSFSQLNKQQQRSFSRLVAASFEPEPSPASSTKVPRPRRSQRLSSQGPDKTLTPVARSSSQSKSTPNFKVSGGARFLAEMVRRSVRQHAETQKSSPEAPMRTPVWLPRSAWSAEPRAYVEASEGKGDDVVISREGHSSAPLPNQKSHLAPPGARCEREREREYFSRFPTY